MSYKKHPVILAQLFAIGAAALVMVSLQYGQAQEKAGQEQKPNGQQQKVTDKFVGNVCPRTLSMIFGGYYYYDCYPEGECGNNTSHLLAGDSRGHLLGCSGSKCADGIGGARFDKDKKPLKKTSHPKGKKMKHNPKHPAENEADGFATPYVASEEFQITGNELATHENNGKKFRVVKVTWIHQGTHSAIVAHECSSGGTAKLKLRNRGKDDNDDVEIVESVGAFNASELVDFQVTSPN